MQELHAQDNGVASSHGFIYGLLFGTAIGAGIALLFAPKTGSELRGQLGTQIADATTKFRRRASEAYDQAAGMVNDMAERTRASVP